LVEEFERAGEVDGVVVGFVRSEDVPAKRKECLS
jgi:hypothetical protein